MSRNHSCSEYRRATRRGIVQAGALSTLGLSLADVLQRPSAATAARSAAADSVIVLWLSGGPSHQDLFDLKPQAPTDVRGEFRPIRTTVPDFEVSELLPRVAKRAHQLALLRGVTHTRGDHQGAQVWHFTGYKPTRPSFALLDPSQDQPSMGAVVTQELGGRGAVPPYVTVPSAYCNGQYNSFLSAACAPFCVNGDPNKDDFQVRDLGRLPVNDGERLARRLRLIQGTSAWMGQQERAAAALSAWDSGAARAYDLVSSAVAQDAFNIRKEPTEVRERYGRNVLGQSTLMARRLIENGVRFVTVDTWYLMDWDTHSNNFKTLKDTFAPRLDGALSALLDDMERSEKLARTTLVILSEFGRTPKVNKDAGRDHWAPCNVALFAGAGIRAGQVLGASDAEAAYPVGRGFSPEEITATVYHLLGVDRERELLDQQNRPWKLATAEPISALLAQG